MKITTSEHLDLWQSARRAARHAYAPYSKFAVGAAVETDDGRIFTGANMENASYGLTMCAEVGALQAASTAGALGSIKRIAVVGGPMNRATGRKNVPLTPCGRCRQLIYEAAVLGKRDISVWCATADLKKRLMTRISRLLPHSFGVENLPRSTGNRVLGRRPKRIPTT